MLRSKWTSLATALLVVASTGCAGVKSHTSPEAEAVMKQGSHMTIPENEIDYLEIVADDAEATRDFYQEAYGWQFGEPVPELGGAFVASLPNGSVCAIRASMHAMETPTVRTYIRVLDVEAAAQKAVDVGATLALDATELPGQGTIAIFLIGGVEQGLWQLPPAAQE